MLGDDLGASWLTLLARAVFNCDDLLINYLVSNLTHTPPLLLQPKTPLRTVPTKGLWNRDDESDTSFMGSSAPPSSDTLPTSEEAAPADPNDPMKSDHFGTRRVCINHYFAHFARYAPSTPSAPASSSSHYPLIRTSTSVSQDVVDRARWLSPGEEWEEPVWHAMDEEGVEERERREREEFEEMIEGMDDEQVRELMEQLEGMQEGDEDDDEEAFEEDEDEEEEGLAHDEL